MVYRIIRDFNLQQYASRYKPCFFQFLCRKMCDSQYCQRNESYSCNRNIESGTTSIHFNILSVLSICTLCSQLYYNYVNILILIASNGRQNPTPTYKPFPALRFRHAGPDISPLSRNRVPLEVWPESVTVLALNNRVIIPLIFFLSLFLMFIQYTQTRRVATKIKTSCHGNMSSSNTLRTESLLS